MPTSSITRGTSLTSSGFRTNDSATKSTPRRSANSRSSASLSDIAGTLTATPGRDRPLLLLTLPPSVTSQTTSVPFSISTATSATLPSSTSSLSPGRTSAASCL